MFMSVFKRVVLVNPCTLVVQWTLVCACAPLYTLTTWFNSYCTAIGNTATLVSLLDGCAPPHAYPACLHTALHDTLFQL
jgi:hypothetical protein